MFLYRYAAGEPCSSGDLGEQSRPVRADCWTRTLRRQLPDPADSGDTGPDGRPHTDTYVGDTGRQSGSRKEQGGRKRSRRRRNGGQRGRQPAECGLQNSQDGETSQLQRTGGKETEDD